MWTGGEVGMIQIDMPMPKSCMECPMCHDHIWCHAPVPLEWGESDVSRHMTDRPEWCPLKEPGTVKMQDGRMKYYCSECGAEIDTEIDYLIREIDAWRFCPCCGGRIERS